MLGVRVRYRWQALLGRLSSPGVTAGVATPAEMEVVENGK